MKSGWSNWSQFPDPNNGGILRAPFGPGVYELRHKKTKELVLFGMGKNTAKRMTSLLSIKNGGAGSRNNVKKQRFVAKKLG